MNKQQTRKTCFTEEQKKKPLHIQKANRQSNSVGSLLDKHQLMAWGEGVCLLKNKLLLLI